MAEKTESKFVFVGNHRCLDFINTQLIVKGNLTDLLGGFDDLIYWLIEAKILDKAEAKEALTRWSGTTEGERAFKQAREFRAMLLRMVERLTNRKKVEQTTIDEINELLRHHPGYTQLVRAHSKFEKQFHPNFSEAIHLIVPIAESASDLLCHGDLSLVKRCENPACVLYFYDTSKNHARRWCSMNICGNRMKVSAHYRRSRSS
ncbi:MAG: CGNR zinc finger domain-containing protein [Acidobacteriota bacterium]